MVGNEGQATVLESNFIEEFETRAEVVEAPNPWPHVSASPYEDFMSEIIEAGNQIMERAYELAAVADQISDWGDQQNTSGGVGGLLDSLEDVFESGIEFTEDWDY
jgi:hypothetical protein